MIHVKIGEPPYNWKPNGKTLEVIDNLMLQRHKGYDTIIINDAHKYPNIALFAKLSKRYDTCVLIGGNLNDNTKELLEIADKFEKI